MMSKWIRKGDRVLVIAGNDKGKAGEVLSRSEDRVHCPRRQHSKEAHEAERRRPKAGASSKWKCPSIFRMYASAIKKISL